MDDGIRSGDAVLSFDTSLRVRSWNTAAERLTGIPAAEALGRPCWEVLGATDEDGSLVCHPGCSGARLAREGFPVPSRRVRVRTGAGPRSVWMSTIALGGGEDTRVLHLLRGEDGRLPDGEAPPLTPRQLQVLRLLADGKGAKAIAAELGIARTTARNHVQAILTELGAHSQLEAVAEGRRRGLL